MLIGIAIACLIAGLVIGFIFGATASANAAKQDFRLLSNQKFEDQLAYFGALRREIANILIVNDPRRFLDLYRRIHEEMVVIERSDRSSKDARLKLISDRYPFINDFDPFQTRDYILYTEGLCSIDELSRLYEDILIYVAITKSANRGTWHATTSDKEMDHLRKYVQQLEDTQFQHEIAGYYRQVRAYEAFVEPLLTKLDIWDKWREAIVETHGSPIGFDSPEFTAQQVFKMPEHGYGFHLKSADQYGTVMSFAGEREMYYSINRSDMLFEKNERLDCLTVDRISVPFEFMARDAVRLKARQR